MITLYSQGENVLNAAKMFEQNNLMDEKVRREPVRSSVHAFSQLSIMTHEKYQVLLKAK